MTGRAATTIVYTTGVFDMLHPGHLAILRRARALGDRLIVGVQEDASVEAQKGRRPIMSTRERITMLRALPFVDQVMPYSSLDQRSMLRAIKPHVLVQGSDWRTTADRSTIIEHASAHGIRIVLLPYTRSISSTAIKERVFATLSDARREKQLEYDLAARLSFVPLRRLCIYESSDPNRTRRLVERIRSSGVLRDPLTVGNIGTGRSLVVDGANRLEALRQLGARYAPVQTLDYLDSGDVRLRGNEHYLDVEPDRFLALMEDAGVPLRVNRTRGAMRLDARTLALVYAHGAVYSLPATGHWQKDITALNALVGGYKGKVAARRRSEVGNLIGNATVLVKFRALTPSDMVALVSKRMRLESGITWHTPTSTVIRLDVPFAVLERGFPNAQAAARHMREFLREKHGGSAIRRYLSYVYVCDEWT